jgi:hypothetical protein
MPFTSHGLKMGKNAIGVVDCDGSPPLFPAYFNRCQCQLKLLSAAAGWLKGLGRVFKIHLKLRSSERQ